MNIINWRTAHARNVAFWVNCYFSCQDFSKKIKTTLISGLDLKAQASDETVKPEFHNPHVVSIFNTITVVPASANVNILEIHPADSAYTVFFFFFFNYRTRTAHKPAGSPHEVREVWR